MSTRQRKTLCRIKVERIAKLVNCIFMVIFVLVCWHFDVDGYICTAVVIPFWMYVPDIVAYFLEDYYHISHDKRTYR